MAHLLEREPQAPERHADPSRSLLPFVARPTAAGVVHERLEHLRPSHRVGRVTTTSARDADMAVVALLALDPALGSLRGQDALFFDCETTGLGGAGTLAFLVGLSWFDGERLVLEQLLVRTPAEERALLERLELRIERAGWLVSYNGKAFDWPLLQSRRVMQHLPPLPERPHLDLLHVARRLHKRRIGACRLVTLESEVLGFERGPDVEGADVAARYGHFLRTGDERSLSAVVDHNAWDVLSMAALLGLYGEPLAGLVEGDWVSLARVFQRARALDRADEVASAAVERAGDPEALRVQALIAKARGDRQRALDGFERLAGELDDPAARLELSKLYEHFLGSPGRALAVAEQGTGEADAAWASRVTRLQRKLAWQGAPGAAPRSRGKPRS